MADRRNESDEALLACTPADAEAFAEFYRRWERPVAAFFMRAVGRGEVAADLTAEAFAEALASAQRFDPDRGRAPAWLFGIARHLLARSREQGRVEDRARARLGMPPLAIDDELIARVEAAGDDATLRLLDDLPDDQERALRARVLQERGYEEIAADLQCSESVVRKRVSRGLAALRTKLGGTR
ncbi:MAG TPA: sigma-70 family RNA polymerase sigma factor [Solirubrobacteraceae bacterium]|nr:sigma-70 family RNA polymerase sigma factor [Solirubrobacteraceae bacterium]